MKKIVLLPLDERPCNFKFPYQLFNGEDLRVVRPERLGDKKTPADVSEVITFLKNECKNADGIVLAMDTLLYGGLIPSRLHTCSEEMIRQRLDTVRQLKAENPALQIYAFQCIMRCPRYSSSDEEPDYYGICGEEIHRIGNIRHRSKLGLCGEEELDALYKAVLPEYLEDYTQRREFNLQFNLKTLDLVEEGIIDFLIIPQDDSAQYGFTAMDQEIVRNRIISGLLHTQVLMYPGADEIAMTLMSRFLNVFHKATPAVYVRYAAQSAPFLIPAYEDRALGETMKYQILAAGCRMAGAISEADIILAVNCPADEMTEAVYQPALNRNYCVERNITDFVLFIQDCVRAGRLVTIGDVAYANGADLELIALLNKLQLLDKVSGYAGWNTSSNTLGTSIAQGVHALHCAMSAPHLDFLAARYVEDAGYCSVVRRHVSKNSLPGLGMDYFNVRESTGAVSRIVHEELQAFIRDRLSSIAPHIQLNAVAMPWRRMFEVDVDVSCRN